MYIAEYVRVRTCNLIRRNMSISVLKMSKCYIGELVTSVGPRRRIDSRMRDEDFENKERGAVDFSDGM